MDTTSGCSAFLWAAIFLQFIGEEWSKRMMTRSEEILQVCVHTGQNLIPMG